MSKTDLSVFRYDMNEEAFRAACAVRCAAHPDLPTLRTIAAVGAYHADFGGSDVDSDRLTKGLIYMARSGVMIAPDFEVDKVNFLYKRNYLAETKPADLVFVSYVLGVQLYGRAMVGHHYEPYKMDSIRLEMAQAADPSYFLDSKLGGVLHTDNTPENWLHRVSSGGARMIYTHGGNHEIGTHTFKKTYVPLIETPSLDKKARGDERDVFQAHAQTLDIPLPWSGFCADSAYLQSLMPAFTNAQTDLAQRARAVCAPPPSFSVDRVASYSL